METLIRIEKHFSALYVKCIERLDGDHGLDVNENSALDLPMVFTRLKQKHEGGVVADRG